MMHTNKPHAGLWPTLFGDELKSKPEKPMSPSDFAVYANGFLTYSPDYMHGEPLKRHVKRVHNAVIRFSSPSFIAFEGEDTMTLASILEAFREVCVCTKNSVDAEEYGDLYVAAGHFLSQLPDPHVILESIK